MSLSKVSVMIKTFLRDRHLFNAVQALRNRMPEVRIIVIDDGYQNAPKDVLYDGLRSGGHEVIILPFDSGFGAKSNAAIAPAQERPYLLVGSDDFDFNPDSVRQGIENLVDVLENTDRDIVSGRVNDNPYEGWLYDQGEKVTEERIHPSGSSHLSSAPRYVNNILYYHCELTVNYSLIRSRCLGPDKLHWFDHIKIGGGEHGAFFINAKRLGYNVAWVPGVNITEQQGVQPTDPHYHQFRGRASQPGRAAFREIGVKEYVLFDGTVERA